MSRRKCPTIGRSGSLNFCKCIFHVAVSKESVQNETGVVFLPLISLSAMAEYLANSRCR